MGIIIKSYHSAVTGINLFHESKGCQFKSKLKVGVLANFVIF